MSLAAYTAKTWTDYADSPDLSAANVQYMDSGIAAVTTEVLALEAMLPSTYQPISAELSALAGLSFTGYAKRTGAGAWSVATAIPQADVSGLTAALAGLQPLDSDLTAIAALTTTTFGRSLLTVADAAAARTAIGAQVAGSYQPLDADLTAVSALATTGFVRRTAADTWAASALVWSDISSGHPSVTAGAGLSGGGALTGSVTLSVAYGTAAGTACVGNDSRVFNGQTAYGWGDHHAAGYASASSLGNYLPLAGGTLTGPLAGTTATFAATASSTGTLLAGTAGSKFAAMGTWAGASSHAWFGASGANSGSWTGYLHDGVSSWLGCSAGGTVKLNYGGADQLILSSTGIAISPSVTFNGSINGTGASFSSAITCNGLTSNFNVSAAETVYGGTLGYFGNWKLGAWTSDPTKAELSHATMYGGNSYGILHGDDGELYLNAATGKSVHIRVNNQGFNTWEDLATFGATQAQFNTPVTFKNSVTFGFGKFDITPWVTAASNYTIPAGSADGQMVLLSGTDAHIAVFPGPTSPIRFREQSGSVTYATQANGYSMILQGRSALAIWNAAGACWNILSV